MSWQGLASQLRRIGLGMLLTLALLAGGLVWFAGTEMALRWAAQQAGPWSGGQLVVRGVTGSLYGPLQIESLRFETEETRIELKAARLDWSPLALLRRHLQIGELTLQELQVVTLKPAATAPALPASLRLPASLSLSKARVDRLVLKEGTTERVLSQLAFALDKPADTYRLNLSSISTPWGSGQAQLTLAEAQPFAVAAQAQIKQDAGPWPYQVQASASGTLASLSLKATAQSRSAQADIEATLTPFEARPFTALQVQASGIDPAELGADLPRADINARLLLRGQGKEAFSGEFSARNAQADSWDKARLPVRTVEARFAGTIRQLDLSHIALDLAQAGRFVGRGQSEGERLTLTLHTDSFDPRGVHSKMQSLKLAGDLRLAADARRQSLLADLRYQGHQLRLDAALQDDTVTVREAIVRAGGGSLHLAGSLALAASRPFQLTGALKGFDPSALGELPRARINATVTGSGQLAPTPQAKLQFAISDSDFRGQPLSGQGRLHLAGNHIRDSTLMLQLARNRLEARGSFGAPGDQLSVQLQARQLAQIDPGLAGQLSASASIGGSFTAPSGNFELQATDFRWRNELRAGKLRASGRLDKGLDGQLALDASASQLSTPQIKLDDASVSAQGQRMQHTLQFAAKNPDIHLAGSLRGGWHDETGWSGQLQRLVNQGRLPISLLAPARLEVAPARFLLANAGFVVAGATVTVPETSYQAGQISSRGEVKGLALAALQGLTTEPPGWKTDLILNGAWDVAARDKVNGRIALWRDRGDIQLPSAPETALALNRLVLELTAVDNLLRGQLAVEGSRLGRLSAEVESRLSRQNAVWGIAGDAALQAAADFSVNSLAWLAPLIDKTGALSLDGALKARLQGSGSFGQPRLTGRIEGEKFRLALPEQGVNLQDGRFLAELQDDVLQLQSLSLRGGKGSLSAQGRLAVTAGAPDMQLNLQADKLEVLSRPDRLLILSGSGEASVRDMKVQLSTRLKADRGLIELPSGDAPSLSDDVVVLGREESEARKAPSYALRMDLDLDLGERFYIKARGLDAQLGGAIKLVSADGGLPRSSGSIRIVKGAYAAYGQRLEIERGILNFQGPVDNPGLNIVAMRKNMEVEAGVAISGSAQAPRVKLVSTPTVPDSEKLSWLVLGHGMDDSSGQDFSALQLAAGSLLAAGESLTLQQRIAHAAGLEEVSLKGAGTLESTMLTLGKRLSSRAYLSYEHGLSGANTLAKVNYTLTKRFSVRAQAGTVPAVDLFYTFSFD